MIEVKYPGKLFLLGEYSIMEPNHSAFILAVKRYLYAQIKESKTLLIQSDYGTITNINDISKDMRYVGEAYQVAQDYLELKGHDLKPFELTLTSELNSEANEKYGFGSSGVVIVSTIDAILKFHHINVDKLTLFKLSVLAQYRMNTLSSGGDLAASIYGGIVFYTRYDEKILSEDIKCVTQVWPFLKIENIKSPYNIEVAWTKQSHDTNIALERFKEFKKSNPFAYQTLLNQANQIVLEAYDSDDIVSSISSYRKWMLKLEEILDYNIGYEAKVSGSGGGDCGFLISKEPVNKEKVKETWSSLGLEYIEKRLK